MLTRIRQNLAILCMFTAACAGAPTGVASGDAGSGGTSADASPATADAAAGGDPSAAVDAGAPAADVGASPSADAGAVDTAPVAPAHDPIFDTPYTPTAEPLLQVPVAEVDLTKDVNILTAAYQDVMAHFDNYSVAVGQKMPEITLWNALGDPVSLSQYQGKSAVLLVTGSASCMIFRDLAQPWFPQVKTLADALTAKTGRKLELVLVYTQEAHPAIDPSPYSGHQWTDQSNVTDKVLVRQPTTFAERVTLVRGLLARFPLDPSRVWVDGMDNATWRLLGQSTNTLHLIDENGTVVFKEEWAFGNTPHNGDGPAPTQPAIPAVMDKIRALLDP